jgi:predicted NBD/HSP70 family sugar kinase
MYCKSLLYLLLDVGVGGGIVLDNRVWRGTHGTASEVSEMMLDPYTSRNCEGERPGSLGAFCSKTGLLTHYHEQSGEPADFNVLLTHLEQENAIAQAVIQEWGQFLGLGLIGLVNILNPERVVFGGQLAMLLPYVQERLDDMLRDCLPGNKGYGFSSDATAVLEISQFGGDSAAMGGAVLVYQSLFQVPDLVLLAG